MTCVCEDPLPNPVPPPASAVTELARELARLNDESSRVLFALGNRKIRTAAEAEVVARLALLLPPGQAHGLMLRLARYVLRISEAARQAAAEAAR